MTLKVGIYNEERHAGREKVMLRLGPSMSHAKAWSFLQQLTLLRPMEGWVFRTSCSFPAPGGLKGVGIFKKDHCC